MCIPGHVNNHKLSVHEGVKYNCDLCDYKETEQETVRIHKLAVHETVKINCDQYQHGHVVLEDTSC